MNRKSTTKNEGKNIIHVARNIPVPGIPENDIILRIISGLAGEFPPTILFPCEWIPRLPFLRGKPAAICALPKKFTIGKFETYVARYLRLPGRRLSYSLIQTSRLLNPNLVNLAKGVSLIHAHYVLPDGYMAKVLSQKLGIPYVITVRQGDTAKIESLPEKSRVRNLYLRVCDQASRICTVNWSEKIFLEQLDYRVILTPHGLDAEHFSAPDIQQSEGEVRILSVTKLELNKRIAWCLRALAEYKGSKRIIYDIVGDGSQRDRLESIAKDSPENVKITFHGKRPHAEAMAYFRKAQIFIQPTERETFGMVYLEALANGCATIGMENTGLHGYFTDDQMLFARHEYSDFRSKLFEIIEDKPKRDALRMAGYTRAKSAFTMDKALDNYRRIYHEL